MSDTRADAGGPTGRDAAGATEGTESTDAAEATSVTEDIEATDTNGTPGSLSGKGRRLDPDTLAALEEERDFLLRSIDDLDREHAAGDIDDADHRTLRDDYAARAAAVMKAIDDQRDAFAAARPPARLGRRLAVAAGIVLVAVLAGVLVARSSGSRGAGQSATGQIRTTPTQDAQKCLGGFRTDPAGTVKCLDKVLQDDPTNSTALTYRSWILYQTGDAGLVATATKGLDKVIAADPTFPDARVFRGIIAYQSGDTATAKEVLSALTAAQRTAYAPMLGPILADLGLDTGSGSAGSSTTVPGASTTMGG